MRLIKRLDRTFIALVFFCAVICFDTYGQNSCETAISITSSGVYDVDNDDGDYWYVFTAPKSGAAYVTTGISSDANNPFKHHQLDDEPGEYKDTKIEIYETCGGDVWLADDDHIGLFDGASEINFEYDGLSFVEGNEYYIRLEDDPQNLGANLGGQYQFEILYEEDIVLGTEAEPLEASLGLNTNYTNLYYAGEQWFSYQLPDDGLFTMELTWSHQSPYFPIETANDVVWLYWYDDDENPVKGFTYSGEKDEVLIFSIGNGSPIRNNTFTVSFDAVDGLSCENSFDLTSDLQVNGRHTFDVDNTDGSQFYKVTVPQDGWLEMTSCTVGYQHNTYMKVYADDCSLITETGTGCTAQAALDFEVFAGETYIFEWDPQELQVPHYLEINAYQYQAQVIFHETVLGQSCDEPKAAVVGENTVDFWFDDQYFTYTATNNGQLEIGTCGHDGFDLYGMELLDGCDGTTIGSSSYACDLNETGAMSISYEMSKDEVVIVKMLENYHERYDYSFNVNFVDQGQTCQDPIDLADFPINAESGRVQVPIDNSESSQFYIFTADKTGSFYITSEMASPPSGESAAFDTDLRVYQTTCDNLVADYEDNKQGNPKRAAYLAEVEIGDVYIFEWSNHNWGGEFEFIYLFEEPVQGRNCAESIQLVNGRNDHTSMLYGQYFEYTAPSAGTLEISTCDIPEAYYLRYADSGQPGLRILDVCDGSSLGTISEDCEDPNELEYYSISYQIESGETVKVKSISRSWFPYHFNANFVTGDGCDTPIALSLGDNEVEDLTFNANWYEFTPDRDGELVIRSIVDDGNHNVPEGIQTSVYAACDDLLLTVNSHSDIKLSVQNGITYLIETAWNRRAGKLNLSYLENLTEGYSSHHPIILDTAGIYDVDNTLGDAWYKFTAPKSGDISITTNFPSIEDHRHLSKRINTTLMLFDAPMSADLVDFDKSLPGDRATISPLTVVEGDVYYIKLDDFHRNINWSNIYFADWTDHYEFEIFYWDDVLHGEDNPKVIEPGEYIAPINYQDEVWYEYTFPADGVLWGISIQDEHEGSGLDFELPDANPVQIYIEINNELLFTDESILPANEHAVQIGYDDGDTYIVKQDIYYRGVKDETIKFKVSEAYGVYGDGNAPFQLIFEESICVGDVESIDVSACGGYTFDGSLLTSSDEYTATFTNQAGCDSLVNLSLTILEEPDAAITLNGVILFAEDQEGVTYQWVDCDTGEALEGETKKQLTPKRAGFYAVDISNENCSVRSACMNSEGQILSAEKIMSEIQLYPNPTSGSIQLDLGHDHQDIEVEVLSITGHRVGQYSAPYTKKIAVDLSEKKGVYFIRVSAGGSLLQTLRVIKE